MMNETGTIIGRLEPSFLRELLLNYHGNQQDIRERLMLWYDDAVALTHENDDLAKIGLVVSKPIIKIGRRLHDSNQKVRK